MIAGPLVVSRCDACHSSASHCRKSGAPPELATILPPDRRSGPWRRRVTPGPGDRRPPRGRGEQASHRLRFTAGRAVGLHPTAHRSEHRIPRVARSPRYGCSRSGRPPLATTAADDLPAAGTAKPRKDRLHQLAGLPTESGSCMLRLAAEVFSGSLEAAILAGQAKRLRCMDD
jgi:hypothetical protein